MALGAAVLFTPHLAPMNRGILATCYATATSDARSAGGPARGLCRRAVRPCVGARRPRPNGRWAPTPSTSPPAAIARTGRVLALAALDNLVKGAAGQMIQCANLMLGLDETAGLPRAGVWP